MKALGETWWMRGRDRNVQRTRITTSGSQDYQLILHTFQRGQANRNPTSLETRKVPSTGPQKRSWSAAQSHPSPTKAKTLTLKHWYHRPNPTVKPDLSTASTISKVSKAKYLPSSGISNMQRVKRKATAKVKVANPRRGCSSWLCSTQQKSPLMTIAQQKVMVSKLP